MDTKPFASVDLSTPDSSAHIRTVADIRAFFSYLASRTVTFHPDDSFSGLFSDSLAVFYDRLMDECFDLCEATGEDIYALAMDVQATKIFVV